MDNSQDKSWTFKMWTKNSGYKTTEDEKNSGQNTKGTYKKRTKYQWTVSGYCISVFAGQHKMSVVLLHKLNTDTFLKNFSVQAFHI